MNVICLIHKLKMVYSKRHSCYLSFLNEVRGEVDFFWRHYHWLPGRAEDEMRVAFYWPRPATDLSASPRNKTIKSRSPTIVAPYTTMSLSWQIAAVLVIVLTVYLFKDKKDRNGRKYVFPPGPKGLPIVGNSFQFPPFGASALTKKWAEQYGEMFVLSPAF